MENLDGMSMDIEKNEREKLKSVFPECFVEDKLDIDKLLNMCGEYITDDFERYEFKWKGKSECLQLAQKRTTGTLRPCKEESVNFDKTKNLYIEGDNLEVLKILQTSYYRKVKMIYIDPPYNTGNDFVYDDDFTDPIAKYKEVTSQATKSNPENMGRFHTAWLNMMYPRLRLAANLLCDDGVCFISIDDHEVHNLRKICDETFGEENFICQFVWINNERGRSIDKFISNTNEYILMYSKSIDCLNVNMKIESGDELLKQYDLKDEVSFYKKGDPLYNNNSKFNIETRPNLVYTIYINKETGEKKCIDEKQKQPDGSWYLPKENMLGDDWIKVIPPLRKTNNLVGCWRWSMQKFIEENEKELIFVKENSGKYMFYSKNRLNENGEKLSKYKNIINNITSSSGTTEVINILKGKYFEHPKPSSLIKLLCKICTSAQSNDFILDFFSGSATTAHAVMQLNAEDGGNRQYIMVQLPELCDEKSEAFKAGYKNICEIGKERIRRAGQKIIKELEESNSQLKIGQEPKVLPDIGFRVFKLDTSNNRAWHYDEKFDENLFIKRLNSMIDRVKPDRTDLDMVYEVILKLGLKLTEPVEKLEFDGKVAYSVGENCLILVCLDEDVEIETVKKMAELAPAQIIFGQNSLRDLSAVSNAKFVLRDLKIEMKFV